MARSPCHNSDTMATPAPEHLAAIPSRKNNGVCHSPVLLARSPTLSILRKATHFHPPSFQVPSTNTSIRYTQPQTRSFRVHINTPPLVQLRKIILINTNLVSLRSCKPSVLLFLLFAFCLPGVHNTLFSQCYNLHPNSRSTGVQHRTWRGSSSLANTP